MKTTSLLIPVALLASGIVDLRAENLKTVDDFRAAAAKANAVLTIPDWEQTPEAVDAMMKNAIATANKALDRSRSAGCGQSHIQEHDRGAR
jgi:hypothetical protein